MPSAAPIRLNVTSSTANSLSIVLGGLNLTDENGKIVYYTVSVRPNSTLNVVPANFTAYINTSLISDQMDCLHRQENQFMECPFRLLFINETSHVVNITAINLQYWTQYEIMASACTCSGCGPYSLPIFARTDEHEPTCSTEMIYALSPTSTSLNITWDPLRFNCTHGSFTGYRAFFGIAEAFSRTTNFSAEWQLFNGTGLQEKYYVDTKNATVEINGLRKFSNYCIAISGSTVKGYGPVSRPLCELTLQDRKMFFVIIVFL